MTSLPSRAYHDGVISADSGGEIKQATCATPQESCAIYLGEELSPDGLNFLDLGGTQDGLELVGLL